MTKLDLTLKEAVMLNNRYSVYARSKVTEVLDKIKFEVEDGKLLGWEIDGRKLAVSAKPNEVVEPHFCNTVEVVNTITDVASYYDKVAERIKEVEEANNKLKESAGDDTEDERRKKSISCPCRGLGTSYDFVFEPPVDPVMAIRSVARSSIGDNSMSGLVHYFVPVNEAAKEAEGKVSNEGLLTQEQLKSLLGK